MLQKIIDTTQDMSTTIDKFSKTMEQNQNKSYFNIKETFESVLYVMKSKLVNYHITVIQEIENLAIYQMEHQLEQLFINLMNNAIDAMENNTTKLLFVTIFKKENELYIEIKDNGIGIEPSIINTLCDPYFTTKHKAQGTGLGLFVVKDFVTKEMAGTLEFENIQYTYDSLSYSGALVKISIPISYKDRWLEHYV
jgi:C4-dicarboxylate-specific signal transduction histidine kinase